MANKEEAENGKGLLKQFDDLKKKHPDAMLLFRQGDFYEMYKEDAVKAAVLLGIAVADKMLPGEKTDMKIARFAHHALDTYLPKLIRSGARVAICDRLETSEQKKSEKESTNQSNNKDMAKKSKKQEEPTSVAKNTAEEKPAKEKKNKRKAENKQEPDSKKEAKQERKPREPQMVTANGEKVTHGHAYQNKANPEEWYFTARMDGKQLKPQRMKEADLAAFQKKKLGVQQLMERYYPTKLMPKVTEDAYKFPKEIAGPEGNITVNKFNVYKEKDEQRP